MPAAQKWGALNAEGGAGRPRAADHTIYHPAGQGLDSQSVPCDVSRRAIFSGGAAQGFIRVPAAETSARAAGRPRIRLIQRDS
jgi:hypothetical protein